MFIWNVRTTKEREDDTGQWGRKNSHTQNPPLCKTNFLYVGGLKAIRKDTKNSRGGPADTPGTVVQGEGSMPSSAACEHDFSWGLNPVSLSIHHVKHPAQSFIGGSLRKTLSSVKVSVLQTLGTCSHKEHRLFFLLQRWMLSCTAGSLISVWHHCGGQCSGN